MAGAYGVKVEPGYNGGDRKSKVKSGPKPKKAAPTVKGATFAVGGPVCNPTINAGKGRGKK